MNENCDNCVYESRRDEISKRMSMCVCVGAKCVNVFVNKVRSNSSKQSSELFFPKFKSRSTFYVVANQGSRARVCAVRSERTVSYVRRQSGRGTRVA